MGGDKVKFVQTIAMKGGAGTRTRLQEQRHVTDAEDPGTLTNVVTAVNNAQLTLQTAVAVRDRIVQSYQAIMQMPI